MPESSSEHRLTRWEALLNAVSEASQASEDDDRYHLHNNDIAERIIRVIGLSAYNSACTSIPPTEKRKKKPAEYFMDYLRTNHSDKLVEINSAIKGF